MRSKPAVFTLRLNESLPGRDPAKWSPIVPSGLDSPVRSKPRISVCFINTLRLERAPARGWCPAGDFKGEKKRPERLDSGRFGSPPPELPNYTSILDSVWQNRKCHFRNGEFANEYRRVVYVSNITSRTHCRGMRHRGGSGHFCWVVAASIPAGTYVFGS
jgi:hypothetical protein